MTLDFSKEHRVTPPAGSEGERTKVRKNDILICITGALTGNVAFVDEELPTAFVNQHVALVRPVDQKVYPKFLAYSLWSDLGAVQFKLTEYGGTKQGPGLDEVKNAKVALPALNAQPRIVEDLDEARADITTTIARARGQIERMQEYRTALIAEAATGKIAVSTAS